MQITNVKVTPIELNLRQPARMSDCPDIHKVMAIFVRIETRQGKTAWGCAIAHPDLSGEDPESAIKACRLCADRARDLHPINIEYSLAELAPLAGESKAARCVFDLAFFDLLGLAADMPLYRLLGGYRNRIQTSATVPIAPVQESVEIAKARAGLGFRMLKIKGGIDPDEDVRRVRAVHRALPDHVLRLDADGGYQVQEALDVARALEGRLEMLEQPTDPLDLDSLSQVTHNSPVPILADQSVSGTSSALDFVIGRYADSISVKIATCGGLSCARQIDAIGRAAGMSMMVGCLIEPALLISAGLSFALSSPNVRYGDLDGNLDLVDDPTVPGFELKEGWLVARDIPGLGCSVDLG